MIEKNISKVKAGPLRKKYFFEAKKNLKKNVATKLEGGG